MRKRRGLIIAIALTTTVFMLAEPAVVSAKTLSEIRQEIQANEKKLEEGRAQENSLSAQIMEMEQKLGELESAISENEAKLEQLKVELEEAENKVATQNENLNARLRNMYKTSSVGYVDVLLDSGSVSEFLTNLELVKMVYSDDQRVLKELKTAREEVEQKKTEVETLQAELQESKKVTEDEKAVIEAKKAEVAKDNEELDKMNDELQAEADRMTSVIASTGSSSSNSTYTGGVLEWPTPSSSIITSPFGYRNHPISGTYSFHTGIDIGAYSGSAILAANGGTVILAGWNGGYGNCVIVDHGGGITTLYAHCSSINVSKGQSVSRGQTIARVGSTGNSTGPHLHFEVRLNGAYKNPLNYV